jgi:UDP-glucose 4-epimerase
MQKILVTGGCGYIGSHVTRQLSEKGYQVTVYDNLSTGSSSALLHGEKLIVGDLADEVMLEKVFTAHQFDVVFHFAASIVVPESVEKPLAYYENNTVNTIKLLKACSKHQVNKIIFSSTAAVYGETDKGTVTEDLPLNPANPYAASKAMVERIIMDVAQVTALKYVILRYFNVAGADPLGRMGQRTPNATHLIKVACETALHKRSKISIFGTDYHTPDGTCIRDYIHIEDLANAHIKALEYLNGGGKSDVFNCGYGRGLSVKEVIDRVKQISQVDFNTEIAPARAGDIAMIIASNRKIKNVMKWEPKYDDIENIVGSALGWEKKLEAAASSQRSEV